MPRPPLAVVVPTRDRPELLERCLVALAGQLGERDELVVCDSASRDPHRVAGIADGVGARVVRCEQKGASLARNAGWRASRAEQVAFVDDDVEVLPGWADAMRDVVLQHGVAFAVGRTLAPTGTSHAASVTSGRPPEVLDRRTKGPLGASNNLAVRRSVLEAVGGFDERLGPGTALRAGEDLELLDRVLEAGWTGRYVHEAAVVHEQWRSPAERRRLELAYGLGMGARVAAAVRRDLRSGMRLLPDALRLGGLLTLLRRADPARVGRPVQPGRDIGTDRLDSGGYLLPLLWRLGAVAGLARGLVRLSPRPVSAAQVPVDD